MRNPRVFIDANCIYKLYFRSLIFTLTKNELLELFWTQTVLAEAAKGLGRRFPQQQQQLATKLRTYFRYFEEGEVKGFEYLIGSLGVGDPSDEHVLAAAVHARCDYLVTFNIKDFKLANHEDAFPLVVSPDDFLVFLAKSQSENFESSVIDWLSRFENPPLNALLAAQVMNSAECPRFSQWLNSKSATIDRRLGQFSGRD